MPYGWLCSQRERRRSPMSTQKIRVREQRLHQIAQIVEAEGSVRVADLARRFGVSEMTVHRDLQELAKRGLVRRVHGGAIAMQSTSPQPCIMCRAPVLEHTRVVIYTKDGSQHNACCPHCGLMYFLNHQDQVEVMLVKDLLHQHVIDARVATYVVDPSTVVCCRPSVLAFHSPDEARRFQRGFGGHVLTFSLAVEYLSNPSTFMEDVS